MSAQPVSLEEREARIWALLDAVPDPEIPVLSITDLGIVRALRTAASGECVVALTPTYSGCPASQAIRESVRAALDAAGHGEVRIEEVLVPAWSSQWLSERGRERLREFGIAPPDFPVASVRELRGAAVIACPRCGSPDSERLSEFGSTPCKAHYRCNACREPFDYFKCI